MEKASPAGLQNLFIRWLTSHPLKPALLAFSMKPVLLDFKSLHQVVNQPPFEASPAGLLYEASPAGLQNLCIRWLTSHPLKPALLAFSMKPALLDFKISASGG